MTAITNLAIAELVIYLLLIPDIGYILYRHGRRGFLGWGFLVVYCVLRITSSGVQISDRNSTSNSGAILNSIGISALLMALSGIIHEAFVCPCVWSDDDEADS